MRSSGIILQVNLRERNMGLLNKIKGLFFDKEEEKQEIISEHKEIIQPKGDLVGICGICQIAIGSGDKTKELNANLVHKRCFKHIKKLMLGGESFENAVNINNGRKA